MTVTEQLEAFVFSFEDLSKMGFDPVFIQDYIDQVRNIQIVAQGTDSGNELAEQNKLRIDQHDLDIQNNTDNINTNAGNIANNTTAISDVASDLSDHESLTSAHGVTGNNVGTGDYCTLLVGGVVDLAALVADLTQFTDPDLIEIVTADIGAAPAAYDQTYTQEVTDLTNENKSKVNEVVVRANDLKTKINETVDKINEILAGQIAAKQMSNV